MAVQLVSKMGNWQLPDGDLVLGRHSKADLFIDDLRLSRRHAEFRVDGDAIVIKDLGSVNGILVNGERLHGSMDLRQDDLVVIGPIAFRVAIDKQTAAYKEVKAPAYQREPSQMEFMPSTDRTANGAQTPGRAHTDLGALRRKSEPHTGVAEALRDNRTTMPLVPAVDENGQPISESQVLRAGATTVDDMPAPAAKEPSTRSRTDQLLPNQSSTVQTDPLLPKNPHEAWVMELRSIRKRRLLAAILDPLTTVMIALLTSVPIALAALVWSLQQAEAVVQKGSIVLGKAGEQLTPLSDLAKAVMTWDTLATLAPLLTSLHAGHRQHFVIFFVGATMAILVAVLIILFNIVAATMLKGGPLWHRVLGLAIREQRTNYFPSAWRSVLRWTLAVTLSPIALVCVCIGWPAPHDLISGCRLGRVGFSTEPQTEENSEAVMVAAA